MAEDILCIQRRIASINEKLQDDHSIDTTLVEQLQADIEVVLEVICQECDEKPELWESDSIMLVQAMSSYNELVTTCLKKIEAIQDENVKIKATLQSMKDRITSLEEELKQLNLDKNKLIIGQVAFEIEKAIVSSILDELIGPHHYINAIEDMERAISGEDSNYADVLTDNQREEAEQSWKDMKLELDWHPRHFRYVEQHRISTAHPDINEVKVKYALENGALPESETKLFSELFTMYKSLKPAATLPMH